MARFSSTMKFYSYLDSPVGRLLLVGTRAALTTIEFSQDDKESAPKDDWQCDEKLFSKTVSQLDEYFSGVRTGFSVVIKLEGTEFQKKVWAALQTIPFGETISYGEVASRMGQPTASRAVGAANNANPIPIIVPCHRVIGADNTMIGFGGGIDIKIKLLELEYRLSSSSKKQGDLFYQE